MQLNENHFGKIIWECNKQHQWSALISDLKNGSGCPVCSQSRSDDLHSASNLQQKKLLTSKEEDISLSTLHSKNNDKLKWQCGKGHTWSSTLDKVKNHKNWCPKCNANG